MFVELTASSPIAGEAASPTEVANLLKLCRGIEIVSHLPSRL